MGSNDRVGCAYEDSWKPPSSLREQRTSYEAPPTTAIKAEALAESAVDDDDCAEAEVVFVEGGSREGGGNPVVSTADYIIPAQLCSDED